MLTGRVHVDAWQDNQSFTRSYIYCKLIVSCHALMRYSSCEQQVKRQYGVQRATSATLRQRCSRVKKKLQYFSNIAATFSIKYYIKILQQYCCNICNIAQCENIAAMLLQYFVLQGQILLPTLNFIRGCGQTARADRKKNVEI